MAVRRWLDDHLLYHYWRQQEEEHRWSQWREYCRHPICHMTLTPCFFWSPYGDDTLFTICMEVGERRLHRTNEGNHEVPSIFWLHKDYIVASQDQQLQIYHKWRERQCKLNNITSHFQPCSPYTLHKDGIGDCFYELSRMAHFVWMIAWRLEFLIGVEAPNIYHLSCLKEANGYHITLSMYLPLLHDESYLVY